MEIVVIVEENHGNIGVAANYKAAKQWLIRKGWIGQYSEIYNHDISKWESLEELYGENWKEAYMNFDKEDMENMGFYLEDEELILRPHIIAPLTYENVRDTYEQMEKKDRLVLIESLKNHLKDEKII